MKKEEQQKQCYQCTRWKYNDRTERIYGQGTGLCEIDNQPKGCNRKGCMVFEKKAVQKSKI